MSIFVELDVDPIATNSTAVEITRGMVGDIKFTRSTETGRGKKRKKKETAGE